MQRINLKSAIKPQAITMNSNLIFITVFFICLGFTPFTYAQDEDNLGTEVVNVVKPYTPTISDAFKVKETPVLNDSVATEKKPVQYNIFSVPVASTFTPAKGKAATVEKAKPVKLYDNYATLGFGNYSSILAELYSNFQISRTDNAGLFFRHNSSQGDIDGVRLDNKYYDTSLDANYTSRQRDMSYRADIGISHQLFNWYGLHPLYHSLPDEAIAAIDPKQTYFGGYLGGKITAEDSFFESAAVQLQYLGDSYSSSEIHFTGKPEFSFPLADLSLEVDGDIDYLNGSFDRMYFGGEGFTYSYLNAGIIPSLVFVNDDLTVSLGVAAYVGLDTENSASDFFLYPRINASYRLVDELMIVYGGADGGLNQNTYNDLKNENPFVSPTLFIAPTNAIFSGFGGIKGKLSNSVGYNLRATYGKEENKPLFVVNPVQELTLPTEDYEYGNSFGLRYDNINTLSFFGELKVAISDAFSLGISGTYFSYNTTNEQVAWNMPDFEASLFTNFNITEQLYGGASLFFVGERMDQSVISGLIIDPEPETVTLDSYLDANVHLGYRFSDRLSVFAKGSNLIGDNYEKWYNYPVQGIQGLLGATYKFDW